MVYWNRSGKGGVLIMSSKFDDLIGFILVIKNENFGKWIIDHENDGTLILWKKWMFQNWILRL